MTDEHVEFEYGVEVLGKGYVADFLVYPELVVDDPYSGTMKLSTAIELAERARKLYISVGCPEIVDTVRVITRTVTVTRGEWRPYNSPGGESVNTTEGTPS